MKAVVIVFPGSNCDRDVAVCLEAAGGQKPYMAWHGDATLPDADVIVLPGGFSYGDYLRCGSMAANSPIMRDVVKRAEQGVCVIGICNGFQVLTECGLLPGALMRNKGLNFVCRDTRLIVERSAAPFTHKYKTGQEITIPVAHNEGNFFADDDTLKAIQDNDQIAFRYAAGDNPNGACLDIAGIVNKQGNVLGMMPHPERMAENALGGADGKGLFDALAEVVS